MDDLIFAPLVLLIGFGIHQVVLRRHELPFERRLLNRSFVLHMAAAVGVILVYTYYYPGGDMTGYHFIGVPIADALRYDFEGAFPEVVSLFFHGDFRLPMESGGAGSTASMQACAVGLLFLLGNSLYAVALAISVASYLAKIVIYRTLRGEFPASEHERILFASVLSPTAIVWSCALLKEPIIMVAFGPTFLGLKWILDGKRLVPGSALVVVGSLFILLIKPYVLIALTIAATVWILWGRALRARGAFTVKPQYLGLAAATLMLGFTVVSSMFPSLSPDRIAESMQTQRRAAASDEGGSNFYLEGPGEPLGDAPSVGRQLALVPLALVTALFRPFIFESFSPLQFLNSIEMAWLTWLFIQVIRRNGWRGVLRRVTANPALMFCVVFVLVLALGTGLSTANLGTLSRYRAPMMPFFLLLLVVLREPETAAAQAPAPGLKTVPA